MCEPHFVFTNFAQNDSTKRENSTESYVNVCSTMFIDNHKSIQSKYRTHTDTNKRKIRISPEWIIIIEVAAVVDAVERIWNALDELISYQYWVCVQISGYILLF